MMNGNSPDYTLKLTPMELLHVNDKLTCSPDQDGWMTVQPPMIERIATVWTNMDHSSESEVAELRVSWDELITIRNSVSAFAMIGSKNVGTPILTKVYEQITRDSKEIEQDTDVEITDKDIEDLMRS